MQGCQKGLNYNVLVWSTIYTVLKCISFFCCGCSHDLTIPSWLFFRYIDIAREGKDTALKLLTVRRKRGLNLGLVHGKAGIYLDKLFCQFRNTYPSIFKVFLLGSSKIYAVCFVCRRSWFLPQNVSHTQSIFPMVNELS